MTKQYQPFESYLDYLDAESQFLKALCTKLGIQQHLDELSSTENQMESKTIVGKTEKVQSENLQLLLSKALKIEQDTRNRIDARLSHTIQSYGDSHLGIQQMESFYKLTGEERLLLTVLSIAGISPRTLNDSVASLALYGPLSVEDLLAVVLNPQDFQSWSEGKDMVTKLVKQGLVTLDFIFPESWPESIFGATARLSTNAFGCITGMDGGCKDVEGADMDSP